MGHSSQIHQESVLNALWLHLSFHHLLTFIRRVELQHVISCQTEFTPLWKLWPFWKHWFLLLFRGLLLRIIFNWLRLELFFLHHSFSNSIQQSLSSLTYCKNLNWNIKIRKEISLQLKSWNSVCWHCIKARANYLILSDLALYIKKITKIRLTQIPSCCISTGKQKDEQWKTAISFALFSRCNTLSFG